MALADWSRTLAHRWSVLAGCAVLGAALGAVPDVPDADEARGAAYSATVTLIPAPDAPASLGDLTRLELAARLADRLDVARIAAERLQVAADLRELAAPVDGQVDRKAGAVLVSARSDDRDTASRTAQAFGDATVTYLRESAGVRLAPIGSTLVSRRPDLRVPATRGGRAATAGAAGLVVGAVLALALPGRVRRLRDRRDVEAAYGLPVVAEVPRLHGSVRHSGDIAITSRPNGQVAEAYRTLRAAVRHHGPLGPNLRGAAAVLAPTVRVLAVTSPRSGDGRSSIVANLAAALAEAGRRVLVVDCDFEHPAAHLYLGGPPFRPGIGLSDLLVSADVATDMRACVSTTVVPGVNVLTIGSRGRTPAGLLLNLSPVIEEALSHEDVVLLDAGAVLVSSDAVDVAQYADAVLLATQVGRTTPEQAQRTRSALAGAGVEVRGVVLIGGKGNPDAAPSYAAVPTARG